MNLGPLVYLIALCACTCVCSPKRIVPSFSKEICRDQGADRCSDGLCDGAIGHESDCDQTAVICKR